MITGRLVLGWSYFPGTLVESIDIRSILSFETPAVYTNDQYQPMIAHLTHAVTVGGIPNEMPMTATAV